MENLTGLSVKPKTWDSLQRIKLKFIIISMKRKTMIIIVAVAFAIIGVVALITFLSKDNRRGIDCMPPMSKSEQKCLNEGKCFCETY